VITSTTAARRTENKITTAQAVTDTKLEDLTREVREHNGFARNMPVLEEQIKVANHRISDLEKLMEPIPFSAHHSRTSCRHRCTNELVWLKNW